MTGVGLDEFARDAKSVDAGCQYEHLARHVGAGLLADGLEHGDDVGTPDLAGDARAPARDKMPVNHLLDRGGGAQLGSGRAAEKLIGQRGKGVRLPPPLPRMHAGYELAECCGCELARLSQADVGVAAEHHADGLWLSTHPAHDEKRNHATVGNPAAKGRLCLVPMDDPLARLGGFQAFEVAVSENGAPSRGHAISPEEEERGCSGLHGGYGGAMSIHVLPYRSMCTEIHERRAL